MTAMDFYLLGIEYKRNEHFSLAIMQFQTAVTLCEEGDQSINPAHCYWSVSEICMRMRQYSAAQELCLEALRYYTNNKDKADCYFRLGKLSLALHWTDAEDYFNTARRYYRDKNERAIFDLKCGILYQEYTEIELAIRVLTKALDGLSDNNNKAEAHFQRAMVYYINYEDNYYRQFFNIKGNLSLAIKDYDIAISLVSNSQSRLPIYYFYRGLAYANLCNHVKALDDFTSVLTCLEVTPNPKFEVHKLYFNRAETYMALGEYTLAAEDYTIALTSTPQLAKEIQNKELKYCVINCPEFYETILKNKLSKEQLKYSEKIKASLSAEGTKNSLSKKIHMLFKPKSDYKKHLLAEYQDREALDEYPELNPKGA